jgi:hypothetical protein
LYYLGTDVLFDIHNNCCFSKFEREKEEKQRRKVSIGPLLFVVINNCCCAIIIKILAAHAGMWWATGAPRPGVTTSEVLQVLEKYFKYF